MSDDQGRGGPGEGPPRRRRSPQHPSPGDPAGAKPADPAPAQPGDTIPRPGRAREFARIIGIDPMFRQAPGGIEPLSPGSGATAQPPTGAPDRPPGPAGDPSAPRRRAAPAADDVLLDPAAIAEDEALFFGDDAWIRFRRPWGFWRRLLVLAGGLALVLGGAFWWGYSWLQRQLDPPGEPQGQFLVEIPSGAGVNEIARILAGEGVVANATITRLWWRDAEGLQAGHYNFAGNMSVDEALAVLEAGPIPPVFESITIPEGLWLSEIADRLLDSLPEFDPAELRVALSDGRIRSKYMPAGVTSLEGVLFPDTYQVDEGGVSDEADLVRRMVEQFDTVAAQIGYDDALGRIGLEPYQLLVAASIVEEEASRSEDRPKVARVIYNRLNAGMKLEMDATVLYAIGQRKSSLTLTDLDTDSPYNTRKFPGLPPTPIAAPGRESLRAAMNPEPGPWLFFVLTERDGTLFFTDDFDEFLLRAADARAREVF